MRRLRLLLLVSAMAVCGTATEADAGGWLSRVFGDGARAGVQARRPAPRPVRTVVPQWRRSRAYPTRNLQQGRTRLPSGRSYYEGRYYGNYNNRFYGPQYGYF